MSASDQKYSDKPDGKAFPVEPWHTHVGMSDQEIRARALECAVRLSDKLYGASELWPMVKEFETYIETGERG